MSARLMFLADSHLGIDLPAKPRVSRRRRGHDFMRNYLLALDHAVRLGCDAIVHGGDVFFRSKVRPEVVHAAFAPLKRLADSGLPVLIVPGNHERSRIPHRMLTQHRNIHVFECPRTVVVTLRGQRIAFAGFPYARSVRACFPSLVTQTGWCRTSADVRLLCVHHCFEGATVGPANYTFRNADDVVRHADVPADFHAVLSGHIHRHQVLQADLTGRALTTPVLYPGSIERTSFAERDERKGFLELTLKPGKLRGRVVEWVFHPLPARPMLTHTVSADQPYPKVRRAMLEILCSAPRDAIVRLFVEGVIAGRNAQLFSAGWLREMAGPTMNVCVRPLESLKRGDAGRGKQMT